MYVGIVETVAKHQHTARMGSGGVITSEESPLIGRNNDDHELHRHLSLFDLVCVGVGATVGSGVFVLIGLIAHTSAGPAVFISWSRYGDVSSM